jgi:transcriptional regulator with XRE-family HTH domain
MKNRCLKQSLIAAKAGYSVNQFNAMLRGTKTIKPSDILKISEALDVTPNELFEKEAV